MSGMGCHGQLSHVHRSSERAYELMGRVEKYRPTSLDEVVSHHDITATCELARTRRAAEHARVKES
jgi:hypothetical protein